MTFSSVYAIVPENMEKEMRLEIQLPKRIEVRDYHEFTYLHDNFKKLNSRIRVREIGFAGGMYQGVVFEYGFFESPEVQAIVKEIKKEAKDQDEA